ncbi:hypothetical protein KI387_024669, partial [Taxus chinensis]
LFYQLFFPGRVKGNWPRIGEDTGETAHVLYLHPSAHGRACYRGRNYSHRRVGQGRRWKMELGARE